MHANRIERHVACIQWTVGTHRPFAHLWARSRYEAYVRLNPRFIVWGALGVLILAGGFLLTRPAGPTRTDIGSSELRQLQSSGAHIVDVRTPVEFASGHIPGAENVPMESLTQSAPSWDKTQPLVVYDSNGARSLNAAQWLTANGFASVYGLKGGMVAWDGQTTKDTTVSGAVKTTGKPVFIDFFSPT